MTAKKRGPDDDFTVALIEKLDLVDAKETVANPLVFYFFSDPDTKYKSKLAVDEINSDIFSEFAGHQLCLDFEGLYYLPLVLDIDEPYEQPLVSADAKKQFLATINDATIKFLKQSFNCTYLALHNSHNNRMHVYFQDCAVSCHIYDELIDHLNDLEEPHQLNLNFDKAKKLMLPYGKKPTKQYRYNYLDGASVVFLSQSFLDYETFSLRSISTISANEKLIASHNGHKLVAINEFTLHMEPADAIASFCKKVDKNFKPQTLFGDYVVKHHKKSPTPTDIHSWLKEFLFKLYSRDATLTEYLFLPNGTAGASIYTLTKIIFDFAPDDESDSKQSNFDVIVDFLSTHLASLNANTYPTTPIVGQTLKAIKKFKKIFRDCYKNYSHNIFLDITLKEYIGIHWNPAKDDVRDFNLTGGHSKVNLPKELNVRNHIIQSMSDLAEITDLRSLKLVVYDLYCKNVYKVTENQSSEEKLCRWSGSKYTSVALKAMVATAYSALSNFWKCLQVATEVQNLTEVANNPTKKYKPTEDKESEKNDISEILQKQARANNFGGRPDNVYPYLIACDLYDGVVFCNLTGLYYISLPCLNLKFCRNMLIEPFHNAHKTLPLEEFNLALLGDFKPHGPLTILSDSEYFFSQLRNNKLFENYLSFVVVPSLYFIDVSTFNFTHISATFNYFEQFTNERLQSTWSIFEPLFKKWQIKLHDVVIMASIFEKMQCRSKSCITLTYQSVRDFILSSFNREMYPHNPKARQDIIFGLANYDYSTLVEDDRYLSDHLFSAWVFLVMYNAFQKDFEDNLPLATILDMAFNQQTTLVTQSVSSILREGSDRFQHYDIFPYDPPQFNVDQIGNLELYREIKTDSFLFSLKDHFYRNHHFTMGQAEFYWQLMFTTNNCNEDDLTELYQMLGFGLFDPTSDRKTAIAFVGRSGSGKSHFVRNLTRFASDAVATLKSSVITEAGSGADGLNASRTQAYITEIPECKMLEGASLKTHLSADTITTRQMYQHHTRGRDISLTLITYNQDLKIKPIDEGIRNRLYIYAVDVRFVDISTTRLVYADGQIGYVFVNPFFEHITENKYYHHGHNEDEANVVHTLAYRQFFDTVSLNNILSNTPTNFVSESCLKQQNKLFAHNSKMYRVLRNCGIEQRPHLKISQKELRSRVEDNLIAADFASFDLFLYALNEHIDIINDTLNGWGIIDKSYLSYSDTIYWAKCKFASEHVEGTNYEGKELEKKINKILLGMGYGGLNRDLMQKCINKFNLFLVTHNQ